MGLKSLFSKEGRHERAVRRAVAKATNVKIKPDDRRPALHLLAQDGGPEAMLGLLGRLNFNYESNSVSDEEEKQYVFEVLVGRGEELVPELRVYLKTAPTLSWGLRILEEISKNEQIWDVVKEVLARHEPGYERDPTRKQQLISFLGELERDEVAALIAPFLEDHDETVRFLCIEALFNQRNEEVAREPLLELLTNEDEESLRIKNRIAQAFVDTGWVVKGYRGTVEKVLAANGGEFIVDGKGKIRRKRGRN